MKSSGFWIGVAAVILAASFVIAFLAGNSGKGQEDSPATAVIRQNGEELYRIDLSLTEEPYTIDIGGKYHNSVRVEKGRIRVESADCPDKICVKKGWISESGDPIVCLPNGLSIEIEGGSGGVDGTAQ